MRYEFHNADSTQPIKLDEKADLVYFDPMYKTKSEQNNYKPIRHRNQRAMVEQKIEPIYPPLENYDEWMIAWVENAVANVKKSGWIVIKLDDYTAYECWPIFKERMEWENTVIWDKRVIGLGRRFRKQHELIMFFKPNKNKATFFNAPNIIRGKSRQTWHGDSKGLALSTIWSCLQNNGGLVNTTVKRFHINETPTDLFSKLLTVFVPAEGLVLDLCMGSGSLGKACKKWGKSYIGYELQPDIFANAKTQIEQTARHTDIRKFFNT
jgi:DNA modification methylase